MTNADSHAIDELKAQIRRKWGHHKRTDLRPETRIRIRREIRVCIQQIRDIQNGDAKEAKFSDEFIKAVKQRQSQT